MVQDCPLEPLDLLTQAVDDCQPHL
jgi:hypothetical protein